MKTALVVILLAAPLSAQDSLSVLFAGNSYTYYNDMPNLFAELAASGRRHVVQDQNTPGGYTLEQHTADPATLGKIEEGRWDFVVLQEQSQIPTIEYWRDSSMYPASRFLDSAIAANNGQTCFFMTWGREFGGRQTRGGHSSPDFVDFFHMQESLRTAYTRIADELGARLAPVGMGWARARTLQPDIDLWEPDNSHPTLLGSYLAACVFYAELFRSSPVGLTFYAGLDPAVARFLQQAAEYAVLGIAESAAGLRPARLRLSPNPCRGSAFLRLTSEADVQPSVFDRAGRRSGILRQAPDRSGWCVSGLAPGVYFVRTRTGDAEPTCLVVVR